MIAGTAAVMLISRSHGQPTWESPHRIPVAFVPAPGLAEVRRANLRGLWLALAVRPAGAADAATQRVCVRSSEPQRLIAQPGSLGQFAVGGHCQLQPVRDVTQLGPGQWPAWPAPDPGCDTPGTV
jgi:hypothetical protein